MPQGDIAEPVRALAVAGADVVAEALTLDGPTCLDVRAGGRRLRLWFADERIGTDDGSPVDALALVLTLAPGTFESSLVADDGLGRLDPAQTRPTQDAIDEAEELVNEALDHGWMIPGPDHVVRWAPRLGGPLGIDDAGWESLVVIGSGRTLAALSTVLGGELAARRAIRDLLLDGLVVIEEPPALRTTVRVPPRALVLPTTVPMPAAPTPAPVASGSELGHAPEVLPASDDGDVRGEPDAPALDGVASHESPDDRELHPDPPLAPADLDATGEHEVAAPDPGADATTDHRSTIAPLPTTTDAGSDDWGQAPQVEEELGWDDAPAPTAPAASWDDAPATEDDPGWDDDVVHVEEVVGWDSTAAPAPVPTPPPPTPAPTAAPAPAPTAAPATSATAAPGASVAPANPLPSAPVATRPAAPAPPAAPMAPSINPSAPTDPNDDALSRAQLYQFLSSMRS